MDDLLDISHKVIPVVVVGDGAATSVNAFTDGYTSTSTRPTPPASALS